MVFFIQKWAPRLGRPSFCSAAAAVVVAAVVVIVVAAVAAAAVAHQQDQNDDPPPVVTAEAIADIVVTAHKKYLLNGIWVGFLTHTILFRGGENVLTGLA